MPHHTGQVEEEGLEEQDEGDPLVVRHHLSVNMLCGVDLRNLLVKGQVVGVLHPAVGVGVHHVGVGEVDRCPTGERGSQVELEGDDCSKDKDHDHSIPAAETVNCVIVLPIGEPGDSRTY